MKFIQLPDLPKGQRVYNAEDIIKIIAVRARVGPEKAVLLVENMENITANDFRVNGIIIAKSSGKICSFCLSKDGSRCEKVSDYFKPNMNVAIRDARSEEEYEFKTAKSNEKRKATRARKMDALVRR